MKRFVLAAAVAASMLSAVGLAVQAQSPAAVAQAGAQAQTTPDVNAFDKRVADAQVQMKLMQEQMDRIRQTQDPQERQRLMQEHWTTMQGAMTAMHGMWGPGMMGGPGMMRGPGMGRGPGMMGGGMGGGGMGWGGMRGYYAPLTPEQQKQRLYMMDQYMGMQQTMMEHMMWRQQWMAPTPAPAPAK